MTKDKRSLHTISLLIFAVLLASLFVPIKNSKPLTACILVVMTVIVRLAIKKKSSLSINKKEVLLLSAIIGVLYVIITHMTGLFFGHYKNPYFAKSELILTTIIPIIAIIITSEIIRSTLLAQKNKLVGFLAFLSCLLADILAFSNIAGITSFNKFMDLIGLTLLPAISANVYYHYASKRYGAAPNIVFRLITTLYTYVIPTLADMSDAILSMIKLILPIAMLALVSSLYEKKRKKVKKKGSKLSSACIVLSVSVVVVIAMLISCQFKYGAIVIATESMTGEINKGDMIIYERYDGQEIKEGQVIVFLENKRKIVHRVVEIEYVGGEIRYYTKGDANDALDSGYRVEEDLFGVTDLKIAYLGYPTLWLRDLLNSRN